MQSQTKLGNARMKLPPTSIPSTIVSFCPYDVAWLERWKIPSKTFAVLTKSSGSWYPFLYVSVMDFASIHSRLRNPVLHLKLYRHGFFGPLQSCNVPNSAFRCNHGLLPFLSYLIMAWDLLPFLSYPSLHILSSLTSYCVSQTPMLRFFILLSTFSLAPTNYSSFFVSALASNAAKHAHDQSFPGPSQHLIPHSASLYFQFSLFPVKSHWPHLECLVPFQFLNPSTVQFCSLCLLKPSHYSPFSVLLVSAPSSASPKPINRLP